MAYDIRRWAPAILQQHPGDRGRLVAYAQHVQGLADALLPQTAAPARSPPFQMEKLVQCVLLSGLLRNAADMKAAMRSALSATLPADLLQPLLARLEDTGTVPAPTTIKRHKLTLHLG